MDIFGYAVPKIGLAAIGLLLLGGVTWLLVKVLEATVSSVTERMLTRVLDSGELMGRRELRSYKQAVAKKDDKNPLGFLRGRSVTIDNVYVPLQFEADGSRLDIKTTIATKQRLAIVGPAGAGKSMALKNTLVEWAKNRVSLSGTPVLVELHRLNNKQSIFDLIAESLERRQIRRNPEQIVKALHKGAMVLLLDGLDEVLTEHRATAIEQLKQIAETYVQTAIVLTCREAVYPHDLEVEYGAAIRVASFDDASIRRFLHRWLRQSGEGSVNVRSEVERVMGNLHASPAILQLARNPLMLTMIATLQSANPGHTLASTRSEFYEMAVDHMLRRDKDMGRWDKIASYQPGHKKIVIRRIALTAQLGKSSTEDLRSLPEQLIFKEIAEILPRLNLDASDAGKILAEIVDRSELIVKVDETNLLYEFRHLTLQEYLAAMELADSPDRLLGYYSASPGRWRETVKLWCGGANRDCTELVRALYAGDDAARLLALECLVEARQIDAELARSVIHHGVSRLGKADLTNDLIVEALGAIVAARGPRGQELLGLLRTRSRSASTDEVKAALRALAVSRLPEAMFFLGRLADDLPEARIALRLAGEQAIPQLMILTQRSLSAVDDISTIGTPAAATALASLLQVDGAAAKRAAWHLAGLVQDAGVEHELKNAEVSVGAPVLTWVWEPFVDREGGPDSLTAIMSRVALLMATSHIDDVPESLNKLDKRIGIPLSVIPASRHRILVDDQLEIDIRSAVDTRPENYLRKSRAPSVPDATVLDLKSRLHEELVAAGVDEIPCRIFSMLDTNTWLVTADLLITRKTGRTQQRDWLTLADPIRRPLARLQRFWAVTTAIIGCALLIAGIAKASAGTFGAWQWGPRWLSITAFALMCIAAAAVGILILSEELNVDWLDTVVDVMDDFEFVMYVVFGLALAAATFYGLVAGSGTIGWPAVAVTVGSMTVVLGAVWSIIWRRDFKARNPFRPLVADVLPSS